MWLLILNLSAGALEVSSILRQEGIQVVTLINGVNLQGTDIQSLTTTIQNELCVLCSALSRANIANEGMSDTFSLLAWTQLTGNFYFIWTPMLVRNSSPWPLLRINVWCPCPWPIRRWCWIVTGFLFKMVLILFTCWYDRYSGRCSGPHQWSWLGIQHKRFVHPSLGAVSEFWSPPAIIMHIGMEEVKGFALNTAPQHRNVPSSKTH